ncbi:MAG: hypothetical protein IT214_03935 [Chitinophagaceae bacterium]|jgi:hypothetical protein|nr:hypothetical protein [Chitinophagaceae bacterium]OQY95806.1 MAG: hypothetical protein B6D37_04940 [Sphingobacteriales bacterium UTBCD1]
MNLHLFLLSNIILVSGFFVTPRENFCRRQGLQGYVYLVSGNQMPSPDRPASKPKGLQTTLYIYRLTSLSDVVRQGESAFYSGISTELVKAVKTDKNGHFKTKLKPGMYSLFLKKDDLFFSSVFDEKNNICPVEVKRGKMTEVVFNANYNAVY